MNELGVRPPIGTPSPSATGPITVEELRYAVGKLKVKRALVQVPADFLKALLDAKTIDEDSWLLKLIQTCWTTKTTPTACYVAKVIPVFQEG